MYFLFCCCCYCCCNGEAKYAHRQLKTGLNKHCTKKITKLGGGLLFCVFSFPAEFCSLPDFSLYQQLFCRFFFHWSEWNPSPYTFCPSEGEKHTPNRPSHRFFNDFFSIALSFVCLCFFYLFYCWSFNSICHILLSCCIFFVVMWGHEHSIDDANKIIMKIISK